MLPSQERSRAGSLTARFCGIFGRSVFSLGQAARRLHTATCKGRQARAAEPGAIQAQNGQNPTPAVASCTLMGRIGTGSLAQDVAVEQARQLATAARNGAPGQRA